MDNINEIRNPLPYNSSRCDYSYGNEVLFRRSDLKNVRLNLRLTQGQMDRINDVLKYTDYSNPTEYCREVIMEKTDQILRKEDRKTRLKSIMRGD